MQQHKSRLTVQEEWGRQVNTPKLTGVFRQTSADELEQLNIANSWKVQCLPSKLLIMKFGDT